MKQQQFEELNQQLWLDAEQFLKLPARKQKRESLSDDLPDVYRAVCYQLALAKERNYSYQLISRLQRIANHLHQMVYDPRFSFQFKFLNFLFIDFPNVIRENRWYVIAGLLLFFLPCFLSAIACYVESDIVYSVHPAEQIRHFESMYDSDKKSFGRERDSDTDIYMFGFYIYNNIGIAFRTFATGFLLGLGSIFFLVYNGLAIGSIMGFMAVSGFQDTFFPFVVGHGSFELTAIALSGAAGLRMGLSILIPGSYTRIAALQVAAKSAAKIMYGVFIMLLIAAFLEAFWSSSSTVSNNVKYMVGSILWAVVLLPLFYMLFSKERR